MEKSNLGGLMLMLTLEKTKKILEKLATNTKSVKIVVDRNSSLKVRKRKNVVRIEGLVETDKEYLAEALQFYLPYLKIK
jgi:translation initiation factor 1 (eIF-1/SUI1)